MALCANDGSDSLIRLSRMQGLTRGAAAALKQVSIFRLSALKDALLDAGGGSPTREAYLSLYLSLRALDESRIHTRLLPIDSIIVDGKRCYRLDSAAAAEVLKEYYPL